MSKILIIEDEVAIADLEKDYLELSGFEVAIENAGDTGLERALKEEFDLVVLDLMLPGMDGFDVCKKIREEKDIPILMVSAKKDDIDSHVSLTDFIEYIEDDATGDFLFLPLSKKNDIVHVMNRILRERIKTQVCGDFLSCLLIIELFFYILLFLVLE